MTVNSQFFLQTFIDISTSLDVTEQVISTEESEAMRSESNGEIYRHSKKMLANFLNVDHT